MGKNVKMDFVERFQPLALNRKNTCQILFQAIVRVY